MNAWKKWMLMALSGLAGIALILVIMKFTVVSVLVDWWWFKSQDLELYFILRKMYRYLVFGFFILTFAAIFAINFWIASRFVGFIDAAHIEGKKDLVRLLHREIRRLYRPLSLIMALPVAIPMFLHWEAAMMFLFGQDSGVTDPLLGRDISFYLFRLPVYHRVQQGVLLVSVMLLLSVAFLYWYERRLLSAKNQTFPRGARIHISILGLVTVVILSWGIMLSRYDILYKTSNLPVFFGPGYAEMRMILPFVWLSAIFLMITGISLIYSANRKTGWRFVFIFGLLFVMSLVAKDAKFFVDNVRTYVVTPNQVVREQKYIDANIRATLSAFDLERVEHIDFEAKPVTAFDATSPALIRRLRNIPVWDRQTLRGVYEEIQGIRTYYTFQAINVDRYNVGGQYRQVYLGAREVDSARLPEAAQNWINLHLQYTHGQGVAMIPAAQSGDEFMTWFIKDVPPQSEYGLISGRNTIYYGLGEKPYVIVPNDTGEIGPPLADGDAIVHYEGTGGIRTGSLLKRWFLATYFDDHNIFFTTKTNPHSRLLFRRNVTEQAQYLTPFFRFEAEPYVVTTRDGIFWLQDAFTTSSHYPLVEPVAEGFNYIRDAVKIVTDAYNGTVSYYAANLEDPILKAYQRMYPGLIKPLEAMPAALRAHIRYPREMFLIQAKIYAKYHLQDPERFYRQEDFWEVSKVSTGDTLAPVRPYYLTIDLLEPGKEEFLLFLPMSPFDRNNLRALLVAGCDGNNYGKLFAYNFPKDTHVYGPAQTSVVIKQDDNIKDQIALWEQQGTRVIWGRMVIEPMDGSLLYIQPIYLQAPGFVKIPELKRLIIALDGAAVMAPSLEEAAVRLGARVERKRMHLQQAIPTSPPPELLEESDTAPVQTQAPLAVEEETAPQDPPLPRMETN